jgi:outer membrane immunogenic protein
MKKLPLAGVALVALAAGPAFAADLPRKAPLRAPPPVFSWTGFYIGGNVGGSFGHAGTSWNIGGVPLGTATTNLNGIIGGFQTGYNWQAGNLLFGIETDFQGTGQKGTTSLTATGGAAPDFNTDQIKLPYFGTIRGRIGLVPSERWLLYVTGGAAYGNVSSNVVSSTVVGGVTISTSGSDNVVHTGWTLGGGLETAITDNWIFRLEYLYVDLGQIGNGCLTAVAPTASGASCFVGPAAPFTSIATRTSVTDNIVRVGLSYKFGAPSPVVAKY